MQIKAQNYKTKAGDINFFYIRRLIGKIECRLAKKKEGREKKGGRGKERQRTKKWGCKLEKNREKKKGKKKEERRQ
jgi:hypothetical protein